MIRACLQNHLLSYNKALARGSYQDGEKEVLLDSCALSWAGTRRAGGQKVCSL